MKWIRLSTIAMVAVCLVWGPNAVASARPACTTDCVTAYALGQINPQPFGITKGPLGSEWFSMNRAIGRIDQQGHRTVYHMPGTAGDPGGGNIGWLTRGRGGAVWFSQRDTAAIGRITANGTVTQFPLPAPSSTQGIVLDHGQVYFTDQAAHVLGVLDPATGNVREFPVPVGGSPVGLAMGPDGNLWFTEPFGQGIGRMTPDGDFTIFPVASGEVPFRITAGPDGALWFSELFGNAVGRITTDGTMSSYPLAGEPLGITTGVDGLLYVSLYAGHELVQMDAHGTVLNQWALTGAESAYQVATGRSGTVWVTDGRGDQVFRVTPYAGS
jgi:streptogramin lyase